MSNIKYLDEALLGWDIHITKNWITKVINISKWNKCNKL